MLRESIILRYILRGILELWKEDIYMATFHIYSEQGPNEAEKLVQGLETNGHTVIRIGSHDAFVGHLARHNLGKEKISNLITDSTKVLELIKNNELRGKSHISVIVKPAVDVNKQATGPLVGRIPSSPAFAPMSPSGQRLLRRILRVSAMTLEATS